MQSKYTIVTLVALEKINAELLVLFLEVSYGGCFHWLVLWTRYLHRRYFVLFLFNLHGVRIDIFFLRFLKLFHHGLLLCEHINAIATSDIYKVTVWYLTHLKHLQNLLLRKFVQFEVFWQLVLFEVFWHHFVWIEFFIKEDCRIGSQLDALLDYISPTTFVIDNSVVKQRPFGLAADFGLHFNLRFF